MCLSMLMKRLYLTPSKGAVQFCLCNLGETQKLGNLMVKHFIEFKEKKATDRAVTMNCIKIMGRVLRLNYAMSKASFSGGK
mmetsp:Transcript_4224/g.6338  ORF Transcript_4224/g.6338 Transcript_4224/m.6338 type:complete len:81 (+) Transcript_4224:580-822(+)